MSLAVRCVQGWSVDCAQDETMLTRWDTPAPSLLLGSTVFLAVVLLIVRAPKLAEDLDRPDFRLAVTVTSPLRTARAADAPDRGHPPWHVSASLPLHQGAYRRLLDKLAERGRAREGLRASGTNDMRPGCTPSRSKVLGDPHAYREEPPGCPEIGATGRGLARSRSSLAQ